MPREERVTYGIRYLDPADDLDWEWANFVSGAYSEPWDVANKFYDQMLAETAPARRERIKAYLGIADRFFLLTRLLGRPDANHEWIYDRCREHEADPFDHLDLWARYHYKDQWTETPVLTTSGWTTHGALKPGDYVFSPSGKPVKVLATRHFTDSACRRITFDNGISFICGAGHLWTVEIPSRNRVSGTNKRIARKSVTLETDEIAKLSTLYRPVVRATQALDMPHADLPIDPYVLGVWLGDGSSDGGAICGIDSEIFAEIESAGEKLSAPHKAGEGRHADYRISTVYGLSTRLRALGLRKNKHIPDAYMLASADQRLALLQGLIDTDGSVSPDNGCVTFAQKDRVLAEQVRVLANSLGFKARLSPVRCTGTWHVVFQASMEQAPCRLPRKLALLKSGGRRLGSQGWRVHSIEPVETVPTNCIQVESPDGLYLSGRELIPTHNSTVITFAHSIQSILAEPEITIGIFSAKADVARPFLEQIKEEFENNDELKGLYSDVLYEHPRQESPSWSKNNGIVVKRSSNTKEKTVEAFGLIEGLPTGRHFRRLVYDDLVTEKLVTNPEIIQKVTTRWELSDNLGCGEGTEKEHIGTRYDFADTYGVILSRKILTPRIYPATENGQLNGDPVFLSKAHWEKVKNTQRGTVAAQMLQNPLAGKQNTFMPQWLRPWHVRPSILNVYIMVDPSRGKSLQGKGKGGASDRTAMAVVGVDSAGNKYLLDGYRHRMSLSERWLNLRNLYLKWSRERGVGFVKVGYERYGMQSDDEYIKEKQRMPGEVALFELVELNWTREGGQSKKHRVERLEPDFKNGRFYLPGFIREQTTHPRTGVTGSFDCFWSINEKDSMIETTPLGEATKEMRLLKQRGEEHRIARSIFRKDEDGRPYDLTRALIEEMLFFPFAPKDDLVDAASRIYDMEPTTPSYSEASEAENINQRDWIDA